MTREVKVALIVGFALILLVGVLISDHVATVSRPGLADVSVEPSSQRGGEPAEQRWSSSVLSERQVRPPLVELGQGSRQAQQVLESLRGSGGDAPDTRDEPQRADRSQRPVPPPVIALGSGSNGTGGGEGARDRSQSTRPTGEASAPAVERWHTVEPNESLWKIAERYYGNGALHEELARANADRVMSGGHVRVGVRLRVPETLGSARLRDRPAPAVREEQAARPAPAERPVATGSATTRQYVILPNDSLGKIAQRELGSARRVEDIMRLNPSIRDPNEIYAGMTIVLPAR